MIITFWRLWFELSNEEWLTGEPTLTVFSLTVHKCDECFSLGVNLLGIELILGFAFGGDPFEPPESQW